MSIEGFVMLQHRGRYAIFNQDGICHELKNSPQTYTAYNFYLVKLDIDLTGSTL